MTVPAVSGAGGDAWYAADRESFVAASQDSVVSDLSSAAASQGWHIESEQHEEWMASVGLLQHELIVRTEILRNALVANDLSDYGDVILEYNFRRRGLRIDCVLLAPGLIAVVEFKRSKLSSSDRDQVINYCVNLVEFHAATRRLCEASGTIVVPVLVMTESRMTEAEGPPAEFHRAPWAAVLRDPIRCDRFGLKDALRSALSLRRARSQVGRATWLASPFSPSSTILDAAISLYGQHDVSAIQEHAAPVERIRACVEEIAQNIEQAIAHRKNRLIFVSGAPGAGKTLVGLHLAFDARFRDDAVFVTGNAPLVDVLSEALKQSYRRGIAKGARVISGYPRENAQLVADNATFKIVKAHNFLGERGKHTASSDGRVVIFDEAQRTYEKGRRVLGRALPDHEADLILASLEKSYESGVVVVVLLGHHQAINRGERGAIAWLEAAERANWEYAIADETMALDELSGLGAWRSHPARLPLEIGHLSHSLRFYRNRGVEEWVDCVMGNDPEAARKKSASLAEQGHQIWLTRDLSAARVWVRERRIGDEQAGVIASGQARRLAAEGLFVDYKPPIAKWMLEPSGDVRSSSMLETVQNQYQIQGLELDYTIVCWDADLRRATEDWIAFKVRGSDWQRDKALDIAKNSYRVLLTRARKGMVLFVPRGDLSHEDTTREPAIYDAVASFLTSCGVRMAEGEDEL